MTFSLWAGGVFVPVIVPGLAEPALTDSACGQDFRAIMWSHAHPGGHGG
jgi:hypothetical protein